MKNKKIISQKQAALLLAKLKKNGKKIVALSGSFDLLHSGHVVSLSEAKKQGDVLVVLLNSDESIRKYKGANRPIVKQNYRAHLLGALEAVDFIVLFDDLNPKKILAKLQPNIYCNGKDWGKNCVEAPVIKKYGGKIHVLRWTPGLSTSAVIKSIIKMSEKPEQKAIFLDRDGTINLDKNGYTYKIADFKLAPTVLTALKRLSKTDYKIIIITNQSGLGRKYYTEKDLHKLHRFMWEKFTKAGIRLDHIYYCPHLPQNNCACRKPKPGMLLQAVKDFGISLHHSWLIGDDDKDVILGREANVKTIKIGKNTKNQIKPLHTVKTLNQAADIILKAL